MIGKPIYPILPTNENKFNETQNVSKDSAPALTASTREIAEYMLGECQKYYNDTVCDFYGYDKSTYSIYEKEAK